MPKIRGVFHPHLVEDAYPAYCQVHDDPSAPGWAGFAKPNQYLEPSFLPDRLVGAAVDRITLPDPNRASPATPVPASPWRPGWR